MHTNGSWQIGGGAAVTCGSANFSYSCEWLIKTSQRNKCKIDLVCGPEDDEWVLQEPIRVVNNTELKEPDQVDHTGPSQSSLCTLHTSQGDQQERSVPRHPSDLGSARPHAATLFDKRAPRQSPKKTVVGLQCFQMWSAHISGRTHRCVNMKREPTPHHTPTTHMHTHTHNNNATDGHFFCWCGEITKRVSCIFVKVWRFTAALR